MTLRNRMAFLAGAIFGIGLLMSGMTDTQKVRGFLDLFGAWDPTLAFVMGGAIIPMALAWRWTIGRKPVLGGTFPARAPARLDARLTVGSALFGIGWGLVGLCPGPALASLTWGGSAGAIFLISMAAAMWATPRLAARLDAARARA